MTGTASVTRVGAAGIAVVAFVFGAAAVIVTSAGATSAGATSVSGPRPPGVPPAPAIGGQDVIAYDLSGLPEGTVLVVERRLGTKGSYVEVARSTRASGSLDVGVDTDTPAVLRLTLVSDSGAVLMTSERQLR